MVGALNAPEPDCCGSRRLRRLGCSEAPGDGRWWERVRTGPPPLAEGVDRWPLSGQQDRREQDEQPSRPAILRTARPSPSPRSPSRPYAQRMRTSTVAGIEVFTTAEQLDALPDAGRAQ